MVTKEIIIREKTKRKKYFSGFAQIFIITKNSLFFED